MHFLIVDDDTIFLSLAKTKLDAVGANSLLAEDGTSALRLAVSQPIDLAVVDLGLPDIDGFELIRRLRALPQLGDTPIVVVTGRDDSAAITRAFNLGATSFLTKPINWQLFEHHVLYVLRSSVLEREARSAQLRAQSESRTKDLIANRIDLALRPLVHQVMNGAERLAMVASGTADTSAAAAEIDALYKTAARIKRDLVGMMFLMRAVSNGLEIEEQLFSAASLMRDVIAETAPSARERSIRLQPHMPSERLATRADRDKLGKALRQLVDNSVRHSPIGSCIEIGAQLLEDGALRLFVDDDGEGMDPEHLARLLALPDSDAAPVDSVGLPGLGLATARMIIDAHGGRLIVRSAPGSGTTANLVLPASRVYLDQIEVA